MNKWNSKKKKTVIITMILLFVISTIGTVIYIKNNRDSLASMEESNVEVSENQGIKTEVNNEQRQSNYDSNNENVENQNQELTDNNGGEATNYAQTDNTGGQSSTQGATTSTTTQETGVTTTQSQGTTQTSTYITEEPWYNKSVGWVPKTLQLDPADVDIYKDNLESRKVAIVNNDENVTTVFKGDIITYKIFVKNNAKYKVENILISDSIPQGTEFVEGSIDNDGTKSDNGEIIWKKDISAREEIIVSYKVKVVLGDNILQIDNTAKVNEENTNTTHNPTITYNKEVKVISVNGQELENQIVTPGTRLRYYINLKNDSMYEATTRITDTIPEGTSLLNSVISGGGELVDNNKIVWNKVTVPAGESKKVYFDVTVNKNRKETVTNVAKIGAEKINNPNEPVEEQYTNTVKTPVFTASKKSRMDYNSNTKTPKLHETNDVTYVITVKNSAKTDDQYVSQLTGTVKLEDKFWIEDSNNKMTYKVGQLVITDENGGEVSTSSIDESFLSNIVIEQLAAGQTATLTYIYTINEMPNPQEILNETTKIKWDEISNNLYWAEPQGEDPSRPNNNKDTSNYKNSSDESDPTEPTADPQDQGKAGLIDTVIIHIEEEFINIEAIKDWQDYNNKYNKRPEGVIFTLLRDGISTGMSLTPSMTNEWKVLFENLRKFNPQGMEYIYSIVENNVMYYKLAQEGFLNGTNNKISITNYLDQLFIAEKRSSKEGLTVKEKEDIDYTVTVYNVGDEDGTTSIMDTFRNDDSEKVTFKSGVVEYYDSFSAEQPSTTVDINEDYLKNKITLNIKGNGKAVIKYIYTAKIIDENKTPDSDGIIRENVVNDLFWAKTNDTDPDDDRYPTNTPIDTVDVNLEKEYTSIIATKIWDDESDTSNRPESVKFILQRNSTDTGIEKLLTSENKIDSNNNKWQVPFENLIKYDANGNLYRYTVREENVEHYIARYSEDGTVVTNKIGEGIQATVITTNANSPTVPMDVVFVLDISSSMLDDPNDRSLKGSGNTNKVNTAKVITMVESVNKAIDEVIKSNSENRIAVQLYNSRISSTDSDYYLIELGKYERNPNGEYIVFNWSDYHKNYSNTNRYDGILTTTVNNKTGKVTEAKTYDEESIIGTYTQAGIQRGEAILTGASDKQVSGKGYTRIPVLILVTDGDPTHYNPTSVGTTNIVPSNDSDKTTYPKVGNRIAKERFNSAEYYYYTMKQLEATKGAISSAYSTGSSLSRTCRLYTIGIGMQGSMAEVLLNPTKSYIENDLEDANNINSSINNNGVRTGQNNGYNNSNKEGANFYKEQQSRLKDMLEGEGDYEALSGNYTDKSFNIQNSTDEPLLDQLEDAFVEVIKDSQEDINNKVIGEERKLDLTEIDVNRKFEITITGTDFDDNEININKTFTTFTAALSNTQLTKYIKEKDGNYYIDLNDLKSGSVKVIYVKNNEV